MPKEKKIKLYNTTIKSIDEEAMPIRFEVSDASIDRYGEKVDLKWGGVIRSEQQVG